MKITQACSIVSSCSLSQGLIICISHVESVGSIGTDYVYSFRIYSLNSQKKIVNLPPAALCTKYYQRCTYISGIIRDDKCTSFPYKEFSGYEM